MKDVLHKTFVGVLREHVIAWRKAEGWSRETVAQVIIEAHEKVNGVSGIVFEPHTKDICEAREVNSQRIFRWLDDETKSNNLIPPNFIPSVIYAMPQHRRLACLSEALVPLGVGVHLVDDSEEGAPDINDVIEAQLAHGAALQAATLAVQNPTPENLEAAELHFVAEEKIRTRLRKKIAAARTKMFGKARDIISKAFNRKVQA